MAQFVNHDAKSENVGADTDAIFDTPDAALSTNAAVASRVEQMSLVDDDECDDEEHEDEFDEGGPGKDDVDPRIYVHFCMCGTNRCGVVGVGETLRSLFERWEGYLRDLRNRKLKFYRYARAMQRELGKAGLKLFFMTAGRFPELLVLDPRRRKMVVDQLKAQAELERRRYEERLLAQLLEGGRRQHSAASSRWELKHAKEMERAGRHHAAAAGGALLRAAVRCAPDDDEWRIAELRRRIRRHTDSSALQQQQQHGLFPHDLSLNPTQFQYNAQI